MNKVELTLLSLFLEKVSENWEIFKEDPELIFDKNIEGITTLNIPPKFFIEYDDREKRIDVMTEKWWKQETGEENFMRRYLSLYRTTNLLVPLSRAPASEIKFFNVLTPEKLKKAVRMVRKHNNTFDSIFFRFTSDNIYAINQFISSEKILEEGWFLAHTWRGISYHIINIYSPSYAALLYPGAPPPKENTELGILDISDLDGWKKLEIKGDEETEMRILMGKVREMREKAGDTENAPHFFVYSMKNGEHSIRKFVPVYYERD